MKNLFNLCVILAFSYWNTPAAPIIETAAGASQVAVPEPTAYQIKEAGANHRVWQNETYEKGPDGQIYARTHKFTELCSGLNFFSSGQWIEAKEQIEVFSGGAIARQGQSQVIFANNLNSPGAIDMQTPDGKRLRSNIIGLIYYDPVTGDAVVIAQLQDSEGQLISDNQVLYADAFDGVKADVLYTYTKGGFEQDVILKQQPPSPEAFGFDPKTTELEVFTEFDSPPPAEVADLKSDGNTIESDQKVSWGAVTLGRGKAFNLGGQDAPADVVKRYVQIQGHYYLIEKVRVKDIQSSLSKLPEQAVNQSRNPVMLAKNLALPKAPQARSQSKPMRLALGKVPANGYVLDYVTLSTSYTNYIFQGDTTYYISGNLNLSGTNTFEAGTVIKYAVNASITIMAGSKVVFQSKPYCPVIFTAKDDSSTGEGISGATGTPSGYYANPALNLGSMGSVTLAEFRIAYASKGLAVSGASPTLYDAQFMKCALAISDVNGAISLENVLFSNIKTNFNATLYTNTISAQNVTFNNAFDLVNGNYTNTFFYLTNCLFVNVTNLTGNITAGNNGFYQSPAVGSGTVTNTAYPLKVAGAGSCYLTNGCAFVDGGTTNVDPFTLKLISGKTVYSPVIFSNTTISVSTNFYIQAQRDTNNPDLGYHYDPLDYVFGVAIATSNVTFAAGTAAGYFYNTANTYAFTFGESVTVSFNGTATAPCHYTKYETVQEGGNGNWKSQGWGGLASRAFTSVAPAIKAKFTIFSLMTGDSNIGRDNGYLLVLAATDCEFWCGCFGAYSCSLNFTNCLFINAAPGLWLNYGSANLTLENCTVKRGYLFADHTTGSVWPVTLLNNAFDQTLFNMSAHGLTTTGVYCDYNSFLLNSNLTVMLGGHEITNLISYNWQTSWFGDFYLPTNSTLINAGNTNASLLGFYHFTTQTNQVKEANSVMDIGYHCVATDAYGNPMDTDGDGIADYLEDANGNGAYDTGDLSDWLISHFNGLSSGKGLQVFTPLK